MSDDVGFVGREVTREALFQLPQNVCRRVAVADLESGRDDITEQAEAGRLTVGQSPTREQEGVRPLQFDPVEELVQQTRLPGACLGNDDRKLRPLPSTT
jgi:hypothetical protein